MDEWIDELPVFGPDFEQLHVFLRDVDGGISPTRFALIFSFDLPTLASAAEVPLDMLRQAPHDERIQRYLRDCLEITHAATRISNSVERALSWVNSAPIKSFGCKTGSILVAAGRKDDVLMYLESLETGFCG